MENASRNKIKVCVTLDPEVVEKMKTLAGDQDRSLSQLMNRVMRKYVNAAEVAGFAVD